MSSRMNMDYKGTWAEFMIPENWYCKWRRDNPGGSDRDFMDYLYACMVLGRLLNRD